jgi:hypothetical protein
MNPMGQLLIVTGLFLVLIGAAFTILPHAGFLGRLPGDVSFHKGNTFFYFPIVSSILISLVLTVLLNLIFARR